MNIPKYMTDKDSLIYVVISEGNYIHESWMVEDQVLVYENIPDNYPSSCLCTFDSLDDYLKSIKDVSWINDNDYIIKNNAEEYGFPFQEHEDEILKRGYF